MGSDSGMHRTYLIIEIYSNKLYNIHVSCPVSGDISWGTVGVTWTFTTITTVFIVLIALKLRGVLKKRRSKAPSGENMSCAFAFVLLAALICFLTL